MLRAMLLPGLLLACHPAVLQGQAPAPATPAQVPGYLAQAHAAYQDGWRLKDELMLLQVVSADAEVHTEDALVRGIDGLVLEWLRPNLWAIQSLRVEPHGFKENGDEIEENGVYHITSSHAECPIHRMPATPGKFLCYADPERKPARADYTHVWKRQTDGTWRIQSVRTQRARPQP